MSAPRWARVLLMWLSPSEGAHDVIGDLEEAHRLRVARHGRRVAAILTGLEALDMAVALVRQRHGGRLPGISLLDLKLAIRMLVKYPGLTVVGGLAMAFAIWVGALTFEVVSQILSPRLPLEEGDRIVGLQNLDSEANRPRAPFLEDFVAWRGELRTIEHLGAFRSASRNLILGEEVSEPIVLAEMSATGFRVARIPPLLGRTLVDDDEAADAPPVVVIGYDVWQARFGGDPGAVGRSVGIGGVTSTVIGVMPEGFAFPVRHSLWVPLREPPIDLAPGQGGPVGVFGRLAPGATAEAAQTELDGLSARRAVAFPAELGRIRPRVMAYALAVQPLPDIGPVGLLAVNAFMVMLLVLICGNVALLVFARAASREAELAVRNALGAGRARIVWQLFAEALVLGGIAALVGLVGASFGVKWYVAMAEADSGGQTPFWIRDGLAPETVLYLCMLTLLAAAIASVGPALRVTDRRVESRLRRTAAGASGLRLSGVWTVVIVAQVAVTVAFPVTAFIFQRYVEQIQSLDLGFAAEAYLRARLEMDPVRNEEASPTTNSPRVASAYRELEERLSEMPEVGGVTFANRLPGSTHPKARVEVEGATGAADMDEPTLHRAARAAIDGDFFSVLGAPLRAGRGFGSGDARSDPAFVIVNQTFVDQILEGRNPVGQRVRYFSPTGEEMPWHEIVGVAPNLGIIGGGGLGTDDLPGVYHPLVLADTNTVEVAVSVRGDPETFAPRLRTVAVAVDPGLRLHELRRMDRASESMWRESEFLYRLLTGISVVALTLSLTGIYSVMSFTVSRRTREIGVRVALGSSHRRIVAAIFRRPILQVGAGIAMGGVVVLIMVRGIVGPLSAREIGLVFAYATFMLGVCMLACVVPTRKALGVEPTDALRADG